MSRGRKQPKLDRTSRGGGGTARSNLFDSSAIRKAVVALVVIKAVGLVLIFDPASAQPFDGAKAAFSLAVAWLLLAVIALALLRYGSGIFVRTRLHIVVAAFAVANILATIGAEDRYVAMFGAQRHVGLTFVLDMIILYVAVALAYRRRKDWATLGVAVGCAGVAAMTYGLVQYAGLDPIVWANYARERPPSTFGNSDKFGHFLATTLMAAIGFAVVHQKGEARRLRVAAAMYAALAAGAVGLIATRGALLGAAVALLPLGLIYLRVTRVRATRWTMLGGAGALLGLAVIGGALLLVSPLGARIRSGLTDTATQQRVFIADAALRAFRDRPLLGHGPDNFGVIYPLYRTPGSVAASSLVNQDSAHSWLLQAAATTGAFGTLSLAAIAATTFLLLWRGVASSAQVAAALLVGVVAYWADGLVAIGSPSVDWMAWVAAGGAATFGRRPLVAPARRVPPLIQVIAIVSALALVATATPAFQASRELNTVRAAQQAGRAERAILSAERAVRLDPGRAEHWYVLGVARQDRGMLPSAADAFRAATERAPYVSGYWSSLALTLTNLTRGGDNSLGGKDAALAAARRAIEADPHYPVPYHVFALIANSFGDHAAALEASEAAIRLYKGEPEYDAVAADAALRLPDVLAARASLERMIRDKDTPVLRVALARISLKLNDRDGARRHLQRALEIDPQNAPALELTRQVGALPP